MLRVRPFKHLLLLGAAFTLAPAASATSAGAVADDLPALIECRAPASEYLRFGTWLVDDKLSHAGYTKVETGNPFLTQYRLATPIRVFGHPAQSIALNSSGIMAVLDSPSAKALASELGVEDALGIPGKFMGERLVSSAQLTDDPDLMVTQRIAINVAEVSTHPGKTLAGCSYRVDVADPDTPSD
jgi:hypothetical protein